MYHTYDCTWCKHALLANPIYVGKSVAHHFYPGNVVFPLHANTADAWLLDEQSRVVSRLQLYVWLCNSGCADLSAIALCASTCNCKWCPDLQMCANTQKMAALASPPPRMS
jgi:hypothetical protein